MCHAEFPHLVKIVESFGTGKIQVLGINTIDRKKRIEADLKGDKLNYPVLIGRGSGIAKKYKISVLPYLYIIDTKGIVHESKIFMKYEEIKEILDNLSPPEKTGEKNN